jgi:hypothetical protein
MAARKRASRKKTTRRKPGGGSRLGAALGRLELPPTLREYARQVQGRLDGLERELTRASADVRRRAARLLREASLQLGRLEARGEAGWRGLTAPYRRQLVDLLRRLEKAVAPPKTRSRRPTAARKATRRVTKAMRDTAEAIDEPSATGG